MKTNTKHKNLIINRLIHGNLIELNRPLRKNIRCSGPNDNMKVLICLKVKYGFPVLAMYSLLARRDFTIWADYLNTYSNDIGFSYVDGHAFWLINDCANMITLKEGLDGLPLLKEEFMELEILPLTAFKNLDCLFPELNN